MTTPRRIDLPRTKGMCPCTLQRRSCAMQHSTLVTATSLPSSIGVVDLSNRLRMINRKVQAGAICTSQAFGGVDDIDAPASGFFTSSFVAGYTSAPTGSSVTLQHNSNLLLGAAFAVVASCIGLIAAVSASRSRKRQLEAHSSAQAGHPDESAHAAQAEATHCMTLRCPLFCGQFCKRP